MNQFFQCKVFIAHIAEDYTMSNFNSPSQVLFFILILTVGVFSVYSMTIGKKKREIGRQKYRSMLISLVERAKEYFGENKFSLMEVSNFLSDDNDSYLICEDKEADLIAVVTFEHIHKMKISEKKKCDIIVEGDSKYISSVKCMISAETLDEDIYIILGAHKHRRKSYVGRFILSSAEEVRNLILNKKTKERKYLK